MWIPGSIHDEQIAIGVLVERGNRRQSFRPGALPCESPECLVVGVVDPGRCIRGRVDNQDRENGPVGRFRDTRKSPLEFNGFPRSGNRQDVTVRRCTRIEFLGQLAFRLGVRGEVLLHGPGRCVAQGFSVDGGPDREFRDDLGLAVQQGV